MSRREAGLTLAIAYWLMDQVTDFPQARQASLVLRPHPQEGKRVWRYSSRSWSCWLQQLYDFCQVLGGIMQSLVILATCTCTLIWSHGAAVQCTCICKSHVWTQTCNLIGSRVPDPELSCRVSKTKKRSARPSASSSSSFDLPRGVWARD